MGHSYVPASMHPSLVWNATNPFKQDSSENLEWKIIGNNKKKVEDPIDTKATDTSKPDKKENLPNLVSKKRKLLSEFDDDSGPLKKKGHKDPSEKPNLHLTPPVPEQFTWNENSCAFDAYFSVLYALWNTNTQKWTETFQQINKEFLGEFSESLETVRNGTMPINAA